MKPEYPFCPLMNRDCYIGCGPEIITSYVNDSGKTEIKEGNMRCDMALRAKEIVRCLRDGHVLGHESAVALSAPFVQNLLYSTLAEHEAIDETMRLESERND